MPSSMSTAASVSMMPSNRSLLVVVLQCLLLSSLSTMQVTADCPATGCGPNGACILDDRSCEPDCEERCKCNPDFAGADCSFQAITCPDAVGPNNVQTCFNGGVCQQQEEVLIGTTTTTQRAWRCDCMAAAVSSGTSPKNVAGHQCEYTSELSCEVGNPDSNYAFCVNGGTCLRMTRAGKPHRGCLCGEDHEGRHCQYRIGTAPASELAYLKEQAALSKDDGIDGVVIFFIFVVIFGVFGGVGWFLYRHYVHNGIESSSDSGKEVESSPAHVTQDHDLQLDEAVPGNGEINGDDDGDGPMHNAEII